MSNYAAALDLGSSKIALAIGEKTDKGVTIAYYGDVKSVGIEKGEIVKDRQTVEAICGLVKSAEERIGEKIEQVTVSLSGKTLTSRSENQTTERKNESSYIEKDELDSLTGKIFKSMEEPGTAVFDAIPQTYCIDEYRGLSHEDVIGRKGRNIEAAYYVISGKDSILKRRLSILDDCALTMKKAILSPIASARAVLTGPEMENGSALVDMGKDCTEIAIVKDNVVREVYTIPFAGESITRDIKTVANVTSKWAETAKVQYGCSCADFTPENKKLVLRNQEGSKEGEIELALLSEVIEARLSEILETVRYYLDNSEYADSLASGIVLTGGCAYMEFIQQLAQAITGRKVRLAAPLGSICSDSDEAAFDAFSSTAVGMVLETISPILSHACDRTSYSRKEVIPQPLTEEPRDLWGNPIPDKKKEKEEKERQRQARKEEEDRKKQEKQAQKEAREKERQQKEAERRQKENEKKKSGGLFDFFGSHQSNNDNA